MPHPRSLIDRICGEFTDMPGLKVTFEQACRLWSANRAECQAALDALIEQGLLYRSPSGVFAASPPPGGVGLTAALVPTISVRCAYCYRLNAVPINEAAGMARFRCASCMRVVGAAAMLA
jgi:hypothetical protein